MPTTFARDIRPLFRDSPDVDTMKAYGLDLSSYGEVKAHAVEILARLDRDVAKLHRNLLWVLQDAHDILEGIARTIGEIE